MSTNHISQRFNWVWDQATQVASMIYDILVSLSVALDASVGTTLWYLWIASGFIGFVTFIFVHEWSNIAYSFDKWKTGVFHEPGERGETVAILLEYFFGKERMHIFHDKRILATSLLLIITGLIGFCIAIVQLYLVVKARKEEVKLRRNWEQKFKNVQPETYLIDQVREAL